MRAILRLNIFCKICLKIFDDEAKKKNIAFNYNMNVEHDHVLTDITKVKEIFVNIISNAIKYTPAGGFCLW